MQIGCNVSTSTMKLNLTNYKHRSYGCIFIYFTSWFYNFDKYTILFSQKDKCTIHIEYKCFLYNIIKLKMDGAILTETNVKIFYQLPSFIAFRMF